MPNDLLRDMYKDDPQNMPDQVNMLALWKVAVEITYWRKEGRGEVRTRLAQVLHLLYNRDGSASGRTLRDAGEIVGVSRSRIAQNRDTAFRCLRHPSRKKVYELRRE
jgi:DNA-directed RNA polymerase sigma subunit (sigma70/sigma32)